MKFRIRHVTPNSSRTVYENNDYDNVEIYIIKMMLGQVESRNIQNDVENYVNSIYMIEMYRDNYNQWYPIAELIYNEQTDWRVIKL